MTGREARSGSPILSFPPIFTSPAKHAPARRGTISSSGIPRAWARVLRFAVRFITASFPSRSRNRRIRSSPAAIFAASYSAETGPGISSTRPFSSISLRNSRIVTPPADREIVGDLQVVEDPRDDHVDELPDGLRPVVEGGGGHHDGGPRIMGGEHVREMDPGEGHLPEEEDAPPALLQGDIGRPVHQGLGVPVGDPGEGLHAAGGDDHAVVPEGPARDEGSEVIVPFVHRPEPVQVHSLVPADLPGGLRDDEPYLGRFRDLFHDPPPIEDPACPRDTDNHNLSHVHLPPYFTRLPGCSAS